MGDLISVLAVSHLAEADAALEALADPKHPQYTIARQVVCTDRPDEYNHSFFHPYCLSILRHELDGPDAARLADQVQLLTIGIPRLVSPDKTLTNKEFDKRLAETKRLLDLYHGRFRRATEQELIGAGGAGWDVMFIPSFAPLGRPATADDVTKGSAIFELGGRGKLAPLKLLAAANIKLKRKEDFPRRVLIVQAEIGPDGKTVYGALGFGVRRTFAADELTDVKPLDEAVAGRGTISEHFP